MKVVVERSRTRVEIGYAVPQHSGELELFITAIPVGPCRIFVETPDAAEGAEISRIVRARSKRVRRK